MTTATEEPARPEELENGARPSFGRRVLRAPVTWVQVLLFPFETVPRVVGAGRFGGVLLALMLCTGAVAATSATRLDLAPAQLRKEAMEAPKTPPGQGQGAAAAQPAMSDREFDEAVEKAYAVEVVKMSAGALLVPLRLLLLALVLFLVMKFVGGKPTIRGLAALTAHAGLPGGVKALLAAAAALRHGRLTPEMVPALVPLPWGALEGPPLQRLLAGFNPFALWTVLILAVGLPHAAAVDKRKAWITMGVCFVLYVLVTL